MRNMIDFFLCWHRKKSNPPFESLISMDSPIPFEQDGCRFVGGHIDTAHTSVFIHSELDKADAFCHFVSNMRCLCAKCRLRLSLFCTSLGLALIYFVVYFWFDMI